MEMEMIWTGYNDPPFPWKCYVILQGLLQHVCLGVFFSLHLYFCCHIQYMLFFCVCLLPSPHFPLPRDQESSSFMCEMLIVCRQMDLEGMLCYLHEFINMHTSFKPQTPIPQAEWSYIQCYSHSSSFGLASETYYPTFNMVMINTLCLWCCMRLHCKMHVMEWVCL